MTAQPLILFFKDIDKNDVELVGGKNANLGEMTKSGFPVPDGFAITINAYDRFFQENNLFDKIYKRLRETDVNKPEELKNSAEEIQKQIIRGTLSNEIKKEIITAYKRLSGRFRKPLLAVRSSATAEDLPGASFAGQQATFLNTSGEANLIEAVKQCWASLFLPRSIFYRVENKIPHEKVKVSVGVQKMVQSEVSGVVFSLDPTTNDKEVIVIEAVWGLGETIVQGTVIPDCYRVQKGTFSILSKEIAEQKIQLLKVGDKTTETKVSLKYIDQQKINDEEIIALAKYADKLQRHYFFPQDAEWAKEKGKLYLVQTRPVTTLKNNGGKGRRKIKDDLVITDSPLLVGVSASPGIATGLVKILSSPKEVGKIKSGDVLVASMTSPDFVPAMKKAVAIVTDEGGTTSHAAIVSRELGIPCVVGTKSATKTLRDGQLISVDGQKGLVFSGGRVKETVLKEKDSPQFSRKTATKIYVNLAEPDLAKKIAKAKVDGVGLLRAEFMIADIGLHPKEAIKLKRQADFITKLKKGIEIFCREFHPRPVVYRATDFKTNEYRLLGGGKKWEPEEPNPMLGFRGAFRYLAWPDVFALELRALKEVQKQFDNIYLMIPFVRSPEELKKIRRLVTAEGLFDKPKFKFWMMVEIPANVILLEEFIKVGLDGVSIGSNDLTMLLTGTDRDNSEVAKEFDERSPAVYWALKKIIKTCNQHRVTSSICGQAPSSYDDLVEKLINYGITSLSINPDSINRVRQVVYLAEERSKIK